MNFEVTRLIVLVRLVMLLERKKRWLCSFVLLCLLWSTPASAYETLKDSKGNPLKWSSGVPISWYLNVKAYRGIPQTKVVQTFQKAFQRWASIRCAKLNFVFRGITTTGAGLLADKKNVIVFKPKLANIFEVNIKWDQKKNVLLDVDVEVDASTQWSLSPQQNQYDLESLAMMVVGSLIGLNNSKVTTATMYNSFGAMSMAKRTLDKDDMAGACFLYPSGQKEACLNAADCPPNASYACKQNQCELTEPAKSPQVCKACKVDADCGTGLLCAPLGVGKVCLQRCSEDSLCPKDSICNGNGTNSECLPTNGVCPAAKCKQDQDCQPNYECKAGACQPKPISGCLRDGDCPGVQKFCVNNRCVECKDGSTQACTCNNGSDSKRECKSNSWGACKCSNPPVCKAGDSQACTCTDGKSGNRTCDSSGFWGVCKCGGAQSCSAGTSRACQCQNGKAGSQMCKPDGKGYEDCSCGTSPGVCAPGETKACTCSSGKSGAQTCSPTGAGWQPCQCQVCTPGSTQVCVCPNGQGSQSCAQSGSGWEACVCGAGGGTGEKNEQDGGTREGAASGAKTCQLNASCDYDEECVRGLCTPKRGCGCATGSLPDAPIWCLAFFLFCLFRRSSRVRRETRG